MSQLLQTPSLPEGEAAEPDRDGSEVAGAKPWHMPGPVPQISAGREENRAGSSAGGQGIICCSCN